MDSGTSANNATINEFKHFDVVSLASDHHYLQSNSSSKAKKKLSDQSNAPVYAKIMKEWRILEKNLPESIYVQVYETRIDLLRAVIIGSPGTPYHGGLFFFDIVLPHDYPKQPPKVHYHSHGYRLNPNLYASGKVCLSLINTWTGKKSEKWTQESTILQLLVSIQGLVLNEEPYFNEPGYEQGRNSGAPQWRKHAIEYNEDAFVLSCKTMVHIMQKPPENFEGFVRQHFRTWAASILAAVKDYEKGHVLAGQFGMNNAASSSSSLVKASKKFKAHMAWAHRHLSQAFDNLICEPKIDETKQEKVKNVVNSNSSSESVKELKKWSFKKMWNSIIKGI